MLILIDLPYLSLQVYLNQSKITIYYLAQFQLRFETNSIVYTMTGQKKDEVFWYFDYFMYYYYFVTYTNSRRRCYFDSSRIEFVIIFSVVWQNSTNYVSVLPAFTRMFNVVLFNIVNSVWLFTDIKIKFQLSNSAWKSWHKMLFPTVRYIQAFYLARSNVFAFGVAF